MPILGVGMDKFFRKLINARKRLPEWNLLFFGHIFSQVTEVKSLLKLKEME